MKNAAIYMRVNRNLDIRNQEMEEHLNACDNLVKAHPDWRLTETYVDVGLGRKAKKCDEKLLEMLDAAYSGKIKVIIIPSILSFTKHTSTPFSLSFLIIESVSLLFLVKERIEGMMMTSILPL